jgi:hypothetical protein
MRIAKLRRAALAALPVLLVGIAGWLCSLSLAAEPQKAGDAKPPIILPKDPKALVLTFDPGAGGFVRKGPAPYLKIQADGAVAVTSLFDGSKKESKLTAQELQDLLRFVIQENDFFNVTAAKIDAAIKDAAGKGPFIAVGGAGTSVIRVEAGGKKHEVSYRGAGAYLRTYPKARPLAQFVAVEKRLSDLAGKVLKGE